MEQMARARGVAAERLQSTSGLRLLTSGPGRLCEALGITREAFNGAELYTAKSRLKVLDDGWSPDKVCETARIGITKSSDMPLRYVIPGNAFVSGTKQSKSRRRI
jgi:DNA-3-methyladenine glycosylase